MLTTEYFSQEIAQLQIQDNYWTSPHVVHISKRRRSEELIVSIWKEETTHLPAMVENKASRSALEALIIQKKIRKCMRHPALVTKPKPQVKVSDVFEGPFLGFTYFFPLLQFFLLR